MFLRLAKKQDDQDCWNKGMTLVKQVMKLCKEAKKEYMQSKLKELS